MKPNTVMVAPKGTITITTEEYAELVASKTLLEVILGASQCEGLCVDRILEAIRKAFPAANTNGDQEDA